MMKNEVEYLLNGIFPFILPTTQKLHTWRSKNELPPPDAHESLAISLQISNKSKKRWEASSPQNVNEAE